MNYTATAVSFTGMTDTWQDRYQVVTIGDEVCIIDLYGDAATIEIDLPEIDPEDVPEYLYEENDRDEAISLYRQQVARMDAQQECDRMNRLDGVLREHIDGWIVRNISECGDDLFKLTKLKWEGLFLKGKFYIYDSFGYKVTEVPSQAASVLLEAYAASRFAQYWTRQIVIDGLR